MSNPTKSILILGGRASKDPNSEMTPTHVSNLVNQEIAKFASIGYDAVFYGADFDNASEAYEDTYTHVKSRHWDAVNIGFGLRGNPQHTALFEKVVNMICEEVVPAPKFLFATAPDEVFEAGKRVLGSEKL